VTGDAELWLNMLPRAKGWEHWSNSLRLLQVQMFIALTSQHVPRILTLNPILYSALQLVIHAPVHHNLRSDGYCLLGRDTCSLEDRFFLKIDFLPWDVQMFTWDFH